MNMNQIKQRQNKTSIQKIHKHMCTCTQVYKGRHRQVDKQLSRQRCKCRQVNRQVDRGIYTY